MKRRTKTKNLNPYAKYKSLLERCVAIKYEDFEEAIKKSTKSPYHCWTSHAAASG